MATLGKQFSSLNHKISLWYGSPVRKKVSVSSEKMTNTKFKLQVSRTFYAPFCKKPEVPRTSFEVTGFFSLTEKRFPSRWRFGTEFPGRPGYRRIMRKTASGTRRKGSPTPADAAPAHTAGWQLHEPAVRHPLRGRALLT